MLLPNIGDTTGFPDGLHHWFKGVGSTPALNRKVYRPFGENMLTLKFFIIGVIAIASRVGLGYFGPNRGNETWGPKNMCM